jgi:hypothetical protein
MVRNIWDGGSTIEAHRKEDGNIVSEWEQRMTALEVFRCQIKRKLKILTSNAVKNGHHEKTNSLPML